MCVLKPTIDFGDAFTLNKMDNLDILVTLPFTMNT